MQIGGTSAGLESLGDQLALQLGKVCLGYLMQLLWVPSQADLLLWRHSFVVRLVVAVHVAIALDGLDLVG